MSSATQLSDSFAVGVNQTYGPKLGLCTGIGIGSTDADDARLFPDGVPSLWKIGGTAGAPSFNASANPSLTYNTPVGYVKALADIPNGGSQGTWVNNTGKTVKAGKYFWGTGSTATKYVTPGPPPGVGVGLTTPSTAAVRNALLNSSWEVRYYFTPALWNNQSADGFGGMAGNFSVAQIGWYITRTQNTRLITITIGKGSTGSTAVNKTYPAWADPLAKWLRFTYTPTPPNGVVDFLWSDDGSTWTDMGTLPLGTGGLAGTPTPASIWFGGQAPGFNTTPGSFYRFEFRSPINGPILAGVDLAQAIAGASACVGLAGEVWTVTGSGSAIQ